MTTYLVLCYGKDGYHYLVQVATTSPEKAVEAVDRTTNPHQILAVTDGDSNVRGNNVYRGRLFYARKAAWSVQEAY